MIRCCSLASGSKGNAFFLESENSKLLIDAGLSLKQLKERLQCIDRTLDQIDAILISHEHTDHIASLPMIEKERHIPILANAETAKAIYHQYHEDFDFRVFTTGESFEFQDLKIEAFAVQHDTLDPVGFVIEAEEKKIGFCTDLGMATSYIKKKLQFCHFLFIESNHSVSMVHASNRSDTYKNRVLGRQGHLANEEAAQLVMDVYHPQLKHIMLAHLSSECNSPEKALHVMQEKLQEKVKVSIALQDTISEVISL
jgi:phosphoribosyl 1,2-cyclic phosphodiesterase